MNVLRFFDAAYVVNLVHRTDRRAETEQMFEQRGYRDWRDYVQFYDAIEPASRGDYPSIGARGVKLTHTAVLRRAMEQNARNVLVMEDDLEISPDLWTRGQEIVDTLNSQDWAIVYLGHHMVDLQATPGDPVLRPSPGPVMHAHMVAFNGHILPRLVEFLESIDGRPAGSPDGGPMHVDGAFNFFASRNPDVKVLIALPCLGFQRCSRSDISPRWFDRVPMLSAIAGVMRRQLRARPLHHPAG